MSTAKQYWYPEGGLILVANMVICRMSKCNNQPQALQVSQDLMPDDAQQLPASLRTPLWTNQHLVPHGNAYIPMQSAIQLLENASAHSVSSSSPRITQQRSQGITSRYLQKWGQVKDAGNLSCEMMPQSEINDDARGLYGYHRIYPAATTVTWSHQKDMSVSPG